jgi:hypothetical protein
MFLDRGKKKEKKKGKHHDSSRCRMIGTSQDAPVRGREECLEPLSNLMRLGAPQSRMKMVRKDSSRFPGSPDFLGMFEKLLFGLGNQGDAEYIGS